MAKFMVMFEVEVEGGLEVALEAARDVMVLAPERGLSVKAVPMPSETPMRWSVTAMGLERRELMVAFDGEARRGIVSIYDPSPRKTGEVDVHSITLPPADIAMLTRGMGMFPIDMMDAMAIADVRRRRRGGA